MAARIDCSRARLGLNKVVHCPSICHALQVKFIAVSGMPILIRETHYDPCSQAKIGGTLRQLDKRARCWVVLVDFDSDGIGKSS